MATSSLQVSEGRSQVVTVLLADPESTLRSIVFASREGLAVAHKVDDAFPQQAAKIVIDTEAFQPGDFVVRSVIAGALRKIEILATDAQHEGLKSLLAMTRDERRLYFDLTRIEFVEGRVLVELPQAVIVATYKGK